jgi:hypothetical protein
MNSRMGGWIEGLMEEYKDGCIICVNGYGGWMYGLDGFINVWIDVWMDGWMEG